uniref:(northern house mosquito) hypothetical protein n=1 Tax=Culex pipiens TaxID=7175 RepID=A0A8D8K8Q3_CULPI
MRRPAEVAKRRTNPAPSRWDQTPLQNRLQNPQNLTTPSTQRNPQWIRSHPASTWAAYRRSAIRIITSTTSTTSTGSESRRKSPRPISTPPTTASSICTHPHRWTNSRLGNPSDIRHKKRSAQPPPRNRPRRCPAVGKTRWTTGTFRRTRRGPATATITCLILRRRTVPPTAAHPNSPRRSP